MINRPIDEVFDFVTNIDKQSQWHSGVLESRKTSKEPVGVGSTGVEVRQLLGRRIEFTFRITDYEPNRRVGFRIMSRPVSIEGTEMFESVEGGPRITFMIHGVAGGLFKLGVPIVNRVASKLAAADFSNLKYMLETQAPRST